MEPNFTKYEMARLIGARSLQISRGAPILLKLNKKELEAINYNPVAIAKRELNQGVLPITIRRPLPEKIKQ